MRQNGQDGERSLSTVNLIHVDFDDDFDDSYYEQAAEQIYDNGGYNPEMLSTPKGSALINETFRVFNTAIDKGLGEEPDPAVSAALRENAFIFSGFKTHAELEQVSQMLTDEKGNIKPFNEFLNDIQSINQDYNHNYLRTEYNQALQAAQMAGKWADFEKNKNFINLQYRTANDERVRASHRILHGTTLPVDDPFWKQYTPPNGWGCRCTVVAVPKDDYPVQDSHGSIAKAESCFKTPKEKMFKENLAEKKRLFPSKHPYLPKGCRECKKGVGSKNLLYNIKNPICQACIAIDECKAREFGQTDTKKWISNIAKQVSSGKVCKTAITISKPQTELIEYAERNGIELGEPVLRISDEKILHALRDAKTDRGAALTHDELSEIAIILPQCNIYYDTTHKNFVYVYKKDGRTIKYVFQPNFTIKVDGTKEKAIHFKTGGRIYNIPDDWIKIKNSN